MPKKGKGGKGRGKGRGISSESAPGREEQRPGPPEDSNRGRGRGRGQQQPEVQKTQQQAEIGASKGTVSPSEVVHFEPYKRPDVSQPSFPQFFDKKGESAASATFPTEEAEFSSQAPGRKKMQEKMDQETLMKLTGLSLERKEPVKQSMAKRPNYARIDERNHILLFVNYFKLSYKDAIIYHYDIDIASSTKENTVGRSLMSEGRTLKEDIKHKVKHVEREKRRNIGKAKCRKIIAEMFENNVTLKKFFPVYDGQKNLFTSKPLPCQESTRFPVDISNEGKEKKDRFYVTITPVEKKDKTNIISLEPLKELYENRSSEIPNEVLLVYDTVMNHRDPPFTQVHFRNSFFSLEGGGKSNLGYGLEIWRGYHQHVQLTELGPVVVINLAAKAFHKAGPVIHYASDVLNADITNIPRLAQYHIKNLSDALKGIQIKVTHQRQPRKYKIKSVAERSAKEIILKDEKKSVAQYMFDRYGKKLNYPHLPCLLMQTSTNNTYLPMEICEITEGQPKIGKLSADLTSKMILNTAVDPKTRKEAIQKNAAQVNNISKNYMNAFGLLMDISLMQVHGRVMAAPQLAYGGNADDKSRITKPNEKGVWRVEGGKKFFKIVKIDNWVLISFADRRRFGYEVLNKYCQFLVQSGRKCGMAIDRPQSVEIYGRDMPTEKAILQAKKSGAQMAIIVLNRRDDYHSYDEVKFLADFKYNLVTQCMEDKTLGRINDQITTNVCLKINVKLGGINHILYQKPQIFFKPMIVFGIDAIHWTRGYGYPSIVSVVGSLNPTATRYALTCDLQRNDKEDKISQEIIRNMKAISSVILNKFKDVNRVEPVKIIVFRDGVSDGQFQHALDYEVSGLQEACTELFNRILPITYLVVQKRHQTRLFPAKPNQGVGRNQNVPPGTCVDRTITHPVFYDYFICSHEGIQGTSKPAHYTVLHDDNKLHCEELQQLCYFLCHTYTRCTRSVSLPAPVMYADLAAARAKKYADLFIASDNASTAGSDTQRDLPPEVERAIRGMQSFENNMFYV